MNEPRENERISSPCWTEVRRMCSLFVHSGCAATSYSIPGKGGIHVDGVFGGFTRWAVVFLIIFVLFILLIPVGYTTTCTTTPVY